jgi:hypothetical protein
MGLGTLCGLQRGKVPDVVDHTLD